jgi:hypothetical protein
LSDPTALSIVWKLVALTGKLGSMVYDPANCAISPVPNNTSPKENKILRMVLGLKKDNE